MLTGVTATTDLTLPSPDLARMRADRLARLQAELVSQELDGAVLLHGPHVTYATGHIPDAVDASHASFRRAVAIVPAEGPPRLHVHGEPGAVVGDVGPAIWPDLDEDAAVMRQTILDVIGDTAGRRLAVDSITGAMVRADVLAGADLTDASRVLGPARLAKTDDEIACIEASQWQAERAMEAARDACVPGASRAEVAGAFLAALWAQGAEHNEIDPIFQVMPRHRAAGPRTFNDDVAFPTGIADATFETGDLVWVDAGHGYEGYASDYGRTWIVGREPNDAELSCFDRWLTIMDATYAAIRPGATLGDVSQAAIAANGGLRPWLPHFYVGHGVGLESAEMPMAGSDLGEEFDDSFVLAPGMIIVVEPIVWDDGIASYRAEEIVTVTDDGHRVLTSGPGYAPFTT
ncbi:MAG: Xaa-Pro peptidase family protein [Acidimicrobiales bacterium]|nr:Xaa-Pro peptidase family protein [Acidimicrobiales bacterium]